MNSLPASIEASLTEAGFTPTEILIIRRLMEEDGLSVRVIAARTGKGLGVIDQAMKKLIKKEIVGKEWINDGYKYVFRSLDAVSKWVMQDLQMKRDALHRKHQDFETFLTTLELDKKRPEIEHYHGEDGVQKAYMRAVAAGKEVLQFLPLTGTPENDPLRDVRDAFSHLRRASGVSARVIAADTALGRRFQTRDPFEFRQTLLLCPKQFVFAFEKIICGDTVTCINHAEQRACHFVYPEMAALERAIFDGIWQGGGVRHASVPIVDAPGQGAVPSSPPPSLPTDHPLKQGLFSHAREFFWSKGSLLTFAVFAFAAGIVTYGVFRYDQHVNLRRLQEKVLSIAATGALQFDVHDLDQLHTLEDIHKPEYAKVIGQLNDIRYQNQWVKYMYILRPTEQKGLYEFVADADSLDPLTKSDINGDGKIDEADENIAPGVKYDVSEIQALREGNIQSAVTNNEPYTDQWGTFISGFGPIKNQQGKTMAVLGVDIFADQLQELALGTPVLAGIFFGIFFLLFFIRLTAFNQLLMRQVWQVLQQTKWPVYAAFMGLFGVSLIFFYWYTASLNLQRVQEQALSIARTGATQFDAKDLNQLQVEADWQKPEWEKVVRTLQHIRDSNENVKYAYIFRRDPFHSQNLVFVSDAVSVNPYANTDGDPDNDVDLDQDGEITSVDYLPWPGQPWAGPPKEAFLGFDRPSASDIFTDQWGPVVSGFVPIKDHAGITVAVLAIDLWADRLEQLNAHTFWPPMVFVLVLFITFVVGKLMLFNRTFLLRIWKALGLAHWLVYASFSVLFVVSIVAFSLYTSWLNTERVKERVLSIALTGISQFDPNDLNELRTEEDWKKPEWAKVVNTLKTIRLNNPGIVFTYIFRKDPTDPTNLVFVSDSHSLNPYANTDADPSNDVDVGGDGSVDSQDILQWPGQPYPEPPAQAFTAFNKPVTTQSFYTDQWGSYLSGYAPIKDNIGNTVAVLAIDIQPEELHQWNVRMFGMPIAFILVAFVLFILVKVMIIHRSFLKDVWKAFEMRKFFLLVALLAEIAFFITLFFYYYTLNTLKNETGAKLMAIAATAAPQFSADDLAQLHFARDMKTEAYQRVFKKLNEVRDQNEKIKFAYIYRFVEEPDVYEFIADADSNYNLSFITQDLNEDGILDKSDENVAPGVRYVPINDQVFKNVLDHPTYTQNFDNSQWGYLLSGTAPIRDGQGVAVAFVGVDMEVGDFYEITRGKFVWSLWFIAAFVILLCAKCLFSRI